MVALSTLTDRSCWGRGSTQHSNRRLWEEASASEKRLWTKSWTRPIAPFNPRWSIMTHSRQAVFKPYAPLNQMCTGARESKNYRDYSRLCLVKYALNFYSPQIPQITLTIRTTIQTQHYKTTDIGIAYLQYTIQILSYTVEIKYLALFKPLRYHWLN